MDLVNVHLGKPLQPINSTRVARFKRTVSGRPHAGQLIVGGESSPKTTKYK